VRGRQVGIQYLEALLRIRAARDASGLAGWGFARPVHVLFVPDEEVGGNRGMKLLLGHALMRHLNPGLVLDEGLASPSREGFNVFYGERKIWWLRVRATGPTGHGSRFIKGPSDRGSGMGGGLVAMPARHT
jgi:aminoacylase